MGAAAVAAAQRDRLRGAGTVEFIAEQDGALLLHGDEHPPAGRAPGDRDDHRPRPGASGSCASPAGEQLPLTQDELTFDGHAIEARIYAEDPSAASCPPPASWCTFRFPPETAQVRVDTGVEAGAEITPWYDPMIAKLIVHGATAPRRSRACARRSRRSRSPGLTTNVDFL